MFKVNSRFKAADTDDIHNREQHSTHYYHVVSYSWDMPIFFVTFNVNDEGSGERLLVQAAGTLGLFAVLKFYESNRICQIEIKSVNRSHPAKPWVTKSIIEAYEGQVVHQGEAINGIKYVCEDKTILYDPPEFSSVDPEKLNRCIHIEKGGVNAD